MDKKCKCSGVFPTRIPTLQNKYPKLGNTTESKKKCTCAKKPPINAASTSGKKDEANPLCCCKDSKNVFFPGVNVDVEPDSTQTIEITVTPSQNDNNENGTITIPVKLRFCSTDTEDGSGNVVPCADVTSTDNFIQCKCTNMLDNLKNDFVFQSCRDKLIYENYLEDLLYEPEEVVVEEIIKEIEFEEQLPIEPEIPEIKEVPWYLDCENYVEPYLQKGFCDPMDETIQTDLISDSFTSTLDELADKKYYFIWNELNLPSPSEIKFTPVEKKRKSRKSDRTGTHTSKKLTAKKKKMQTSTCCTSNDNDQYLLTPIIFPSSNISFVFEDLCVRNEHYLKFLFRYFPLEEPVTSPCTSKPEMPWKILALPEILEVRKLEKLKCQEEISTSELYLCTCSLDDDLDDIQKINYDVNMDESDIFNQFPCSCFSEQNRIKNEYPPYFSNPDFCTKECCDLIEKKATKTVNLKEIKQDNNLVKNRINPPSCPWKVKSQPLTCKYRNENMNFPFDGSPSTSTDILKRCCSKYSSSYRSNGKIGCFNPKSNSSNLFHQDPVILAYRTCEAELEPFKQELTNVQQKLKNLNMPELDCLFSKEDFLSCKFTGSMPSTNTTTSATMTTLYDSSTTNWYKPCHCLSNISNVNEIFSSYTPTTSDYSQNEFCVPIYFGNKSEYTPISSNPSERKVPTKRNKGIQKTGNYRYKQKNNRCYGKTKEISRVSTDSSCQYSVSQCNNPESYPITPQSKVPKSQMNKTKCINTTVLCSQESQCSFQMESLESVNNQQCSTNKKITYVTKYPTTNMDNIKVHFKIRSCDKKITEKKYCN